MLAMVTAAPADEAPPEGVAEEPDSSPVVVVASEVRELLEFDVFEVRVARLRVVLRLALPPVTPADGTGVLP